MKETNEEIVQDYLARVPPKDRGAGADWILDKRAKGKSANTLRCYLSSFHAISKLSPKPLLKSTKKDVQKLQIAIREKYKDPTIYLHVIRNFLSYHGKDSVASFISLSFKKSKRDWQDPEKVLNRSDVGRMLSVTRDVRDRCLISMLWDSGGRAHEIASIQNGDLERKNDSNGKLIFTLWFRKQKVAGEERRIPLYESSKYILRWLRAHPDPENKEATLFPSAGRQVKELSPIHTNTIRDIVRIAGRLAKIEKPTHPHSFRHGRATDLKMRGVSDDAIRVYMGWVKDSTMPTLYVSRTQQDQMNEIASKLGFEPLPAPGPVKELESDEFLLPPLSELESVRDEKYDQLSKEMRELKRTSLRNEARLDTLLDHLARRVPSISTDPRVVREQMSHASWDDDMEGENEEETVFLRGKLAEFEAKRGQFLDKARERYWKERSERITDEE